MARRLLPALRQHPLLVYFALAYGISCLLLLLLGGALGLPVSLVIALFTAGPTAAAVIVTAVVQGPSGLRRLLRRIGLWRVGVRWYLVALLGIPLVLPRLQARLGPLGGTLLLGVLWGVWRLPQYLVPAWAEESGGLHPASVVLFLLMALALAPILTWLYNHTQGSILLSTLAHASVNTTLGVVVNPLFPRAANDPVPAVLDVGVVALELTAATRGRLGYRRRAGRDAARER